MNKEMEEALCQAVVYLIQVRVHQMNDAGRREARDEALGYLSTLREAWGARRITEMPPPAQVDEEEGENEARRLR